MEDGRRSLAPLLRGGADARAREEERDALLVVRHFNARLPAK